MAVDKVVHSWTEVEVVIVVKAVTVWTVDFDLALVVDGGMVRVAVHSAAQCKHKSRTPLGQRTVMNRYPTQALTGPGSTPEHSTVVNRSNSGLKHKGHVRMTIVVVSVVVRDVVAGAFVIVAVSDAVASVVVRDVVEVADILFEVAAVLAVVV
jgi:hypothetical protein